MVTLHWLAILHLIFVGVKAAVFTSKCCNFGRTFPGPRADRAHPLIPRTMKVSISLRNLKFISKFVISKFRWRHFWRRNQYKCIYCNRRVLKFRSVLQPLGVEMSQGSLEKAGNSVRPRISQPKKSVPRGPTITSQTDQETSKLPFVGEPRVDLQIPVCSRPQSWCKTIRRRRVSGQKGQKNCQSSKHNFGNFGPETHRNAGTEMLWKLSNSHTVFFLHFLR